ncbi:flavodoxin [Eubacteriaceae bacterium ES2]|nr:flavodoxin [Eubacteriaceae bacterium ES2]
MTKPLIVYYSRFKSTEKLALEIAVLTDGVLMELIPENDYSFNYNTAVKEVRSQIERGFCPPLKPINESIEGYQTIFIGSPNWLKKLAPPVKTFLKQYDFSGKTIIPFCTHGGGGFGDIEKDIAEICQLSEIKSGFASTSMVETELLENWLSSLE